MVKRTREPNRDEKIEQFLVSKNVTFTFKQGMNTKSIDVERSLRNQARLGAPLNEKTVKQYTEAIHDGDVFPPILVERISPQKFMVLDGNHRLKAHMNAGEPIDAYICEGTPQQLVQLTFLANTKHGLPSSPEDRLHHALFMVDNGMTIPQAARTLNVPRADLRKAVLQQQAERRADDCGILRTEWESIASSARNRLLGVTSDEGFVAAFKLARDAGLDTDECFRMVTKLNETRSAKRQESMVKAMRLEYAERIAEVQVAGAPRRGKKASPSPRTRLASAMGMVTALPAVAIYKNLDVPDDMRAELVKKADEAIAYLTEVREALT